MEQIEKPFTPEGRMLEKARRLADSHTSIDELLADVLALDSNDQVGRGGCNDIAKRVVGEYADKKQATARPFP